MIANERYRFQCPRANDLDAAGIGFPDDVEAL